MISSAVFIYAMVFASAAILIYGLLQYRDSRRTIRERVGRTDGSVSAINAGSKKETRLASGSPAS